MKKSLLMVGSVPLETPEEVFDTFGRALGPHLPYIPDGETDERIWWVNMLAYRVFHGHPDIETLERPPRENGVEKWKPANRHELWSFKVKEGVKEVKFGDPGWRLGYTKDAVNSYFVFRTLREKGALSADVRFQVSLPMTNSAIDVFFRDPADYDRLKPGFEEAMRQEIAKMVKKIPPKDLAIQWDYCIETMDLEGSFPWTPKTNVLERNLAPIPRLSPHIPEEVALGYHLCYGTLGGWPMVEPKDLSNAVVLANEVVARSGRRVDFVHIPILDTTDETYFVPLRDLNVGSTTVYFGAVHNMKDAERFKWRLRLLKRYVPEFGLAAPCGFGRHQPHELPGIIEDHLRATETLATLH
jgi:hypothetical protein